MGAVEEGFVLIRKFVYYRNKTFKFFVKRIQTYSFIQQMHMLWWVGSTGVAQMLDFIQPLISSVHKTC